MSSGTIKRLFRPRWILTAIAVIGSAGCGQWPGESGSKPLPPSAAQDISVRVAGVEEYRATLAKLRGKVVLVDFWATWCPACVEQFPHTVELYRKYAQRGLAVVSVSLDEPEDEPQVRAFLTDVGASFDNLLNKYGTGTKATEAFGLAGAVPYYRVYDRSGELRREFGVEPSAARQFGPSDIEGAIVELLE
jgi:thiol-disulfide isomerase/thioredoxin